MAQNSKFTVLLKLPHMVSFQLPFEFWMRLLQYRQTLCQQVCSYHHQNPFVLTCFWVLLKTRQKCAVEQMGSAIGHTAHVISSESSIPLPFYFKSNTSFTGYFHRPSTFWWNFNALIQSLSDQNWLHLWCNHFGIVSSRMTSKLTLT